MAEIPDDIRETARATLVAEFGDDEDRPVWMQRDEFVGVIARAILAERERCAQIAEQYANTYCARISDGLASAIRETAR